MNNIQELRKIIADAPEGATHYGIYEDGEVFYLKEDGSYYAMHKDYWSRLSAVIGHIDSLSQALTIVEQAERIAELELWIEYAVKHDLQMPEWIRNSAARLLDKQTEKR